MSARCNQCSTPLAPGAIKCPNCGAPQRTSTRAAPAGSARITSRARPLKRPRPTTRRTVFAHERIAMETSRRLNAAGLPLDFSVASLALVDDYLQRHAQGADGLLAGASPEDHLLMVGSYVGETMRKRLGGDWNDLIEGDDLATRIQLVLPDGRVCWPLAMVRDEMSAGHDGRMLCLEETERLGESRPSERGAGEEARAWGRVAETLRRTGRFAPARAMIARATGLDEQQASHWRVKGEIEEQMGLGAEALASFRRALALTSPQDSLSGELQVRIAALSSNPASDAMTRLPAASSPPPPGTELSTEIELIPELALGTPLSERAPPLADPRSGPTPPISTVPPRRSVKVARRGSVRSLPPAIVPADLDPPASAPPSSIPSSTEVPTPRERPLPPSSATPPVADPAPVAAPAGPVASAAPVEPDASPVVPPPAALPSTTPPAARASQMPPRRTSSPPARRTLMPPARRAISEPSMPSVAAPTRSTPRINQSDHSEFAMDTMADSLIDLAKKGEIEFVDALLDESLGDWPSIQHELFGWLERSSERATADGKRVACAVAMVLADRKGFRPGASEDEAEGALQLLEKASLTLGAALPPLTRAKLLLALAATYSDRLAGDANRNQEEALQLVQTVIGSVDARAQPELWSRAHRLLGNVHLRRLQAGRKDGFQAAVGALRAALRAITPAANPELWGATQLDLANVHRARQGTERREGIEAALEALQAALVHLTRERSPIDWAMAKQTLGICLLERDVADRVSSVERAITALQESLTSLPPGTPEEADSHYRLGLAFQRRKTGDRLDNLRRAIEHYEHALPQLEESEARSAQENLDAARRELKKK